MYKQFPPAVRQQRVLRQCFPKKKGYNANEVDLLDKLLALDPNQRLSASQALDHDYFYDEDPPMMRREA